MKWPKNKMVQEHFLENRAKSTKQWLICLDLCDDTHEYDSGLHHLCLLQYVTLPESFANVNHITDKHWFEEFMQSCMYAPNMDFMTEIVQRNGMKCIPLDYFYQVMNRIVAENDNMEDLEAILV